MRASRLALMACIRAIVSGRSRVFHVKHIHKSIHNGGQTTAVCGQNSGSVPLRQTTRQIRLTRSRLLILAAGASILLAACGDVAPAAGWASPVRLPDGSLLIPGKPGEVRAIDPASGSERWHFPNSLADNNSERFEVKGAFYATPILDKERIYLVSYEGHLLRLDRNESGALSNPWISQLREAVVATPVLSGGRLYVPTESGKVVVVNAEDGATVTKYRAGDGRIWGAPLIAGDHLILSNFDHKSTHALRLSDGQEAWTTDAAGGSIAAVVPSGPNVLIGSLDGSLHALDTTRGEARWAFEADGWVTGAPLVAGDTIYAPTMGGSVYSLTLDGQQRWQYTLTTEKPEFRATPVIANGILVAVARRGVVVGLDPATGQQRWLTTIKDVRLDANPIVIDGSVYLMTTKHALFRVDASTGAQQQISAPSD